MAKVRNVALALPAGAPHQERILRGVVEYARRHGEWTFTGSPETFALSVSGLKDWVGDGVIAEVTTQAEARAAATLGVPVVNMSGVLRDSGLPRVMVDHRELGCMAAEHLLERGFRRFGYYGLRSVWYSELRGSGFIERVARAGAECLELQTVSSIGRRRPWSHWMDELTKWLEGLVSPVGLFAVHDYRARMVVDACDRAGLRVPHDVAVIGVNNDDITCEFCDPPLSSVSRNGRQVGYQAAELLDRLMSGRRPPRRDNLISPDGVVQRRSTDVLAIDDVHVKTVVDFIRKNADRQFGIEALTPLVPISRRWLEHRFRLSLGCTPHEFLCRTRVERAKQLLSGPEKTPLGRIAAACGFSDTRRLRLVFERLTGTTPARYRRSLDTVCR